MSNGPVELYDAIDLIAPHVVRIMTPDSSGTGIAIGVTEGAVTVATAAHVIAKANDQSELITVRHHFTRSEIGVAPQCRAIKSDSLKDVASMTFLLGGIQLPSKTIAFCPPDRRLVIGHPIGWLGYPCLAPDSMCFFSGHVSAWIESEQVYLIDGVMINGVSGGPVFIMQPDGPLVIGIVSAYAANRSTGDTLPGLGVARSVSNFFR